MKLDARTAAELYRANLITHIEAVDMLQAMGYRKHDAEMLFALSVERPPKIEYKEYTIPEGGDSAAW